MYAINATVNGLSRLDRIFPAIEALGWRHASYGVKDHHYSAVGVAWTTVYGAPASTMREAVACPRV